MKLIQLFAAMVTLTTAGTAIAQPAYEAAPPDRSVVQDAAIREAAYLARVNEVLNWRASGATVKTDDPGNLGLAAVACKLALGEDLEDCSLSVIEVMKDPGTGPFWMFPNVCVAFLGRDHLTAEAKAAIRETWRTTRQLRGDTENHWVMYYASLLLMSELYPNEPGESWYNVLTSE